MGKFVVAECNDQQARGPRYPRLRVASSLRRVIHFLAGEENSRFGSRNEEASWSGGACGCERFFRGGGAI